ncbi:MAG TPA: inosine/xanthosine triphosphatase [Chloroflexi bacterium]|nr:inosine/xanthosine triphosphatase [Chloroflexota bacterium]
MPITIAVASKNPVKIAAAKVILARAFPDARFVSAAVSSGVREQPWGDEETRRGALNRARAVLKEVDADFGLGLEGGVMETPVGLMTCAWCAIMNSDGRVGFGGGLNMLLPPVIAEVLRAHGELGPAMDALVNQQNTKQKGGAIGILTNNLSSRQLAYEQLVAMAAAPFVTGFYYN